MDEGTKQMKLAYWAGIIKESKSSGMMISEWCRINQISRRQYYYWHNKVMHDSYELAVRYGLLPDTGIEQPGREVPAEPEFAELTMPDADKEDGHYRDPGINITWNGFTIEVSHGFSEVELARVLEVMKHV